MGNRLNAALAVLFLLFHLIQGMPLDAASPLERAVLEKRQPPPNTCPDNAHPAAKHYHNTRCVQMQGNKKLLKAQCRGNSAVRVYCGVPIVGVQDFVDIDCAFNEFCFPDSGTNCIGYEGRSMDACVRDLVPGNVDTLGRCYATQGIEIPQTGAVLLHAHTSGVHANWKDFESGQALADKSYFDEFLYGPASASLRVVIACTNAVYYSVFKI
ncbi:uncharacterized protein J3D65DRAFT_678179 [Phyllosticta citribraziliensis]|uniref:Uncharacterized protein n=1 Tax=Phyllosticta citribraziliensis TaxID=989973 RepID=A0ABR1LHM4_9PEZI